MLAKIALLDSAVIRALLVALASLVGLILSFFGVDEALFSAHAGRVIDAVLLLLATSSSLYAGWARATKPTPPLTETAVHKTALMDKKQGGSFRIGAAILLACVSGAAVVVMPGCTSTRAAYEAADSVDEHAFVVAEHYAALVREAADLRENPATPPEAVAAMQAADRRARPLVEKLRPLADAYQRGRTAETEADLQAAVNDAVLAIADFVRALKAARGTP